MGLGHLFEHRLEVFDMMASSARCSVRQLVALCRGVELGVADAPLPDLDEWLSVCVCDAVFVWVLESSRWSL